MSDSSSKKELRFIGSIPLIRTTGIGEFAIDSDNPDASTSIIVTYEDGTERILDCEVCHSIAFTLVSKGYYLECKSCGMTGWKFELEEKG